MNHREGYSPNAAGEAMGKFCSDARRALRARLTKPADDDEADWDVYVEALVRIRCMDYNELRAVLILLDKAGGMFRIRNFGNDQDCADIGALKLALRAYVGKSVTVEDLRAGGKTHYLDVNDWGINESYGSRLVVNDLALLLEVPGHPVYA